MRPLRDGRRLLHYLFENFRRDSPWLSVRIDSRMKRIALHKNSPLLFHKIIDPDTDTLGLPEPAGNLHFTVISRAFFVLATALYYGKENAMFFKLPVGKSDFTKILRSKLFEPYIIDRVVHHAHLVGFGIPYTEIDGKSQAGLTYERLYEQKKAGNVEIY